MNTSTTTASSLEQHFCWAVTYKNPIDGRTRVLNGGLSEDEADDLIRTFGPTAPLEHQLPGLRKVQA